MSKRTGPEAELVATIVRLLHESPSPTRVGVEVRSHGRASTDVVVLCAGEVVAIEAKVADWKRAVAQAFLNRHCADRSYIAVWSDRVTPAMVETAREFEIGVYGVSDDALDAVVVAPLATPSAFLRSTIAACLESTEPVR